MNDKELHKKTQKKQLRARRGWSLPLLGPLLLCCMPCFAAASLSETTGRSLELRSIDQSLDRPVGPPKLINRSATAMAPCARVLSNWTPTADGVSCLHFQQILVGLPTSAASFDVQGVDLYGVGLPIRYNRSQSVSTYNRTETFGFVDRLLDVAVSGSPELLFQWLAAASFGVWGCAVALLLLFPTVYHESCLVLEAPHTKPLKSHHPSCSSSRFIGRGRGKVCAVQGVRTKRRLQPCIVCACCRYSGRRRLCAVRARCRDRVWRQLRLRQAARWLGKNRSKAWARRWATAPRRSGSSVVLARLHPATAHAGRSKTGHVASQAARVWWYAAGVGKGRSCKLRALRSALSSSSVARKDKRPEADGTDLKETSPETTEVFRRARRVCWGLTAVVLLGLLVCLSEPRPGSFSFLHAVRVGEASNPGPQSNSDADSALASALLEVLRSWKRPGGTGGSGTPDAHDAAKLKPGKGKGKASPTQDSGNDKSQGSFLADRLIQMLRAAIAQKWSEDKLAERLTNKLQTWQTERNHQQVCEPEPQLQSLDAAPNKGKGKQKVQGDASASSSKGFPKGKGKGVPQSSPLLQASAKTKPQPPRQNQPRYATQVARAEWDSEPVLCTPGSLKKALSDGNEVVGNLIVSRDPNCVAEVQAICDAFGFEGRALGSNSW